LKRYQKMLVGVAITVFILWLLLYLVPYFLKGQILKQIDLAIEEAVFAQVGYEHKKFNVSLLSNFPNIAVNFYDYSVVGKEDFKKDTLLQGQNLSIVFNTWAILTDGEDKIQRLIASNVTILTKKLKNGRQNWTIEKKKPDDKDKKKKPKRIGFELPIRNWSIEQLNWKHEDDSSQLYTMLSELTLKGKASNGGNWLTIQNQLKINQIALSYKNRWRLEKQFFNSSVKVLLDRQKIKISLQENSFMINGLEFGLKGFVQPLPKGVDFNLQFASKGNQFKNLLSLIPDLFAKDFDKIKSEGILSLDGFVKGQLTKDSLPAFNLNLKIYDGLFRYADAQKAINNINVDMMLNNRDGLLESTVFNIRKFHIDLGINPIDVNLLWEGWQNARVNARVYSRINLEDLNEIFQIKSNYLNGFFRMDAKFNGVYAKEQIPEIEGFASLKKGVFRFYQDVPFVEEMSFKVTTDNATGTPQGFILKMDSTKLRVNQDSVTWRLNLKNLYKPVMDFQAKGTLDLKDFQQVLEQGQTLQGKVNLNAIASGEWESFMKEATNKIILQSNIQVKDFQFSDSLNLPKGIQAKDLQIVSNPQSTNITSNQLLLGPSNAQFTARFENYLSSLSKRDTLLRGSLILRSPDLDILQWIPSDGSNALTKNFLQILDLDHFKNFNLLLKIKNNKIIIEPVKLEKGFYRLKVQGEADQSQNLRAEILFELDTEKLDFATRSFLASYLNTSLLDAKILQIQLDISGKSQKPNVDRKIKKIEKYSF
jgi:hypothetical protein